jgi:hypothetical protein
MKRLGVQVAAFAAVLVLSGCSMFHWPEWAKFHDSFSFEEYTERPRSYLEICLEHDFLVRVKPWERGVLSRADMSRAPDPLDAARRSHTFFSKEASFQGGSAGGGGCGCN